MTEQDLRRTAAELKAPSSEALEDSPVKVYSSCSKRLLSIGLGRLLPVR